MFGGNKIRVLFFKIINRENSLFATFSVMNPKKVMYFDKVVDLTKLDVLSKEEPLFVGVLGYKDSIYTPTNTTREWSKGHSGYINLFNTLLSGDDERVRETLGVDDNWDGEWDPGDVIRGDEETFVKKRLEEYKMANAEPTVYWHCTHITMVNPTGRQYKWVGENPSGWGGFFSVDFSPRQVFELCALCKEKAKTEPVDVVGDSFLVRPDDRITGKVTLVVGQKFKNQKIIRYDAKLVELGE